MYSSYNPCIFTWQGEVGTDVTAVKHVFFTGRLMLKLRIFVFVQKETYLRRMKTVLQLIKRRYPLMARIPILTYQILDD